MSNPQETEIKEVLLILKQLFGAENIPQLILSLERASQGLPLEDDPFLGLLKKYLLSETTITQNTLQADTHGFMRYFAIEYPKTLGFLDKMADQFDRYHKTVEGKNWDLTVALQQARQKQELSSNLTIQPLSQMPQAQQEKRGIMDRIRGKKNEPPG